jgi:uncharacterized protein
MNQRNIKFQSYDGYKLEGTLAIAEKEKGALVFVHGITSSRDELGFHADYAKFLSQNGISSLRFDLRYHEKEGTPLNKLSLCGIVNDIEAAFIALKDNVSKDLKSFFIVGTSFGGGLAAYWADFNNRNEIKKIILNAPVINYEDDVLERNGLAENGMLSGKAQKQLARKEFVKSSDIHFGRGLINELKYVNGISAVEKLGDKIVIFHGDEDEDVPLASTRKYMSKQSVLKIIKGVGHGFGVEDDEDLDFPETKEIHQGIYKEALIIIEKAL